MLAQGRGYLVTLVCSRCGCLRSQRLDARGYPTSTTSYAYPEGYRLVVEGAGVADIAAAARLALLRRASGA